MKQYLQLFHEVSGKTSLELASQDKPETRADYIAGDHSTHTVDLWMGSNLNVTYSLDPLRHSDSGNDDKLAPLFNLSNAELVRYLTPNAKLIIALREPVSRCYSLYKMHEATSPEDFHAGVVNGMQWWNECVSSKRHTITDCMYMSFTMLKGFQPRQDCTWLSRGIDTIRRSIYFLFLKEWFHVFPREQFLTYRFEDYVIDESAMINDVIYPFLGLPPASDDVRQRIRDNRRVDAFNLKGINSAGRSIDRHYKKSMLPETKLILTTFFEPYNKQLALLLHDERYKWKK